MSCRTVGSVPVVHHLDDGFGGWEYFSSDWLELTSCVSKAAEDPGTAAEQRLPDPGVWTLMMCCLRAQGVGGSLLFSAI